MLHRFLLSGLCAATFSAGMLGQSPVFMQIGQVVHSFGGSSVALMDTGLQTLTPLQVLPTGVNVVALTWDPYRPDDLVVAGSDNRIWRATVTSANVTRTPLTSQTLPGVRQLSWDQNGDLLVVGEAFGDVLWRIDPLTGVRTTLLSYPLSGVRCGAQNPQTGDYYIGAQQGLWRVTGVPTGSPSVTLVAPVPSNITSIAFDPLQPQFLLFTRSQDLYRLDMNTLVVEPVWTGSQAIDLIRTAHDGTFRAVRSRNVFLQSNPANVPAGGVPPVLIGANTNIGCCSLVDATVVGGTHAPFHLDIDSQPGCGAVFTIDNAPVGASSTWMFFSASTTFPQGTGPFFGLVPDGVTLTLMSAFADPLPGSFLHSLGAPPPVTVIPPGVLCFLSGQTWDVVVVAWGPTLQYAGRTNVVRLTWQ